MLSRLFSSTHFFDKDDDKPWNLYSWNQISLSLYKLQSKCSLSPRVRHWRTDRWQPRMKDSCFRPSPLWPSDRTEIWSVSVPSCRTWTFHWNENCRLMRFSWLVYGENETSTPEPHIRVQRKRRKLRRLTLRSFRNKLPFGITIYINQKLVYKFLLNEGFSRCFGVKCTTRIAHTQECLFTEGKQCLRSVWKVLLLLGGGRLSERHASSTTQPPFDAGQNLAVRQWDASTKQLLCTTKDLENLLQMLLRPSGGGQGF